MGQLDTPTGPGSEPITLSAIEDRKGTSRPFMACTCCGKTPVVSSATGLDKVTKYRCKECFYSLDSDNPIPYPDVEDRKSTCSCDTSKESGNVDIREFTTGATRDTDEGKYDYEGFYSPLVMERFAQYMTLHRKQSDGNLRASDNWQKGIPKDAYMKSAWRHFIDVWKEHRGIDTTEGLEDALCALLFNVQGYLFETLKEKS